MTIEQANDHAGGGSLAGSSSSGDDGGRQRDEAFVSLLRSGDESAFGLLFDVWVDPVYDRLVNRGFTPDKALDLEVEAFSTAHRRVLQGSSSNDPFRVVALRAARQEVLSQSGNRQDMTPPVGPYAEDRLLRGTDARSLASDAAVAGLLWQAADLLGEQVREVLDLHHRHGLTSAEVAGVLQEPTGSVEEILRKVSAGYGAVVRARIVWRQGAPLHDELREQVAGEPRFDAAMVRRVAEHLRGCETCREASQVPIAPIDVFAAIPIALASASFKESAVARLAGQGLPLAGSASSRSSGPLPTEVLPAAAAVAVAAEAPVAPSTGPTSDPAIDETPADEPAARADDEDRSGRGAGVAAAGVAAAGIGAAGLAAAASGSQAADATELVEPPIKTNRKGQADPAELGRAAALGTIPAGEAAVAAGAGAGAPPPGAGGKTNKGNRGRFILVGVATVLVLALLAYLAIHGSSSKKAADVNTGDSSTTTAAPTTTLGSTTTAAPTTTVKKGGKPQPTTTTSITSTTLPGSTTTVTITTTTRLPTPTTSTIPPPPGVHPNLSMANAGPFSIPNGYWALDSATAPVLTWSVQANVPVTVSVTGPGFSETGPTGTSVDLCPTGNVQFINGHSSCVIVPAPPPANYGTAWTYTLKVFDSHGKLVSQLQAVLSVQNHK